MDENNFVMELIAHLNKRLSKSAINNDLKSLNNSMYVKVVAKLSKTLTRKELNNQLKQLNNLEAKIKANVKIDDKEKARLESNIRSLQKSLSDIEIGLKANPSKINTEADSIRNTIQKRVGKNPISINFDYKKNKIISDIEYLGKRYSKLFSNDSASEKYQSILSKAYSIANDQQLSTARAELQAFTAELKSAGLAGQSTADKYKRLIDRSKELFSAATILRTVFLQVKQSVNTFLELDTAMTNLYKVQDQITSRDQFSGLLAKWNKLAQNLAVTTESLISSMEAWSKIGFDLNMSEQLAQITSIFEKTAEISNEKATSTLISAAQAFTEIDDLGVDDYVKRVEAVGNKINAVGNKYSIDSEGIADGLQNASAALKVAGNDLNETISLITATNKIYQSPEEASNMLKVASMRLRGQVDALKEIGEDAEGVSTDITKIQQQVYELTGNKVNIFEDEDTLKSTYQMILEIGEVFDSLSDRQQADLLETMFGKQRASAGASLLLNYEELEKIKNDSINAAGSMAEEYSKYMESAEAHITIFKEKLVETYSTFMSGDLIKYTADVGSGLLDLVNSTDVLRHSLLAISTINIGKGITAIGTSITTAAKQMNTLGSAIQQVKSLPVENIARKDALKEIGNATKTLIDKNLKLLLSQEKLEDSDKIRILRAQDLSKEEARNKLEKMGLIKATTTQSAANVTEAVTTNLLSGAMNSLKASITGVGASIKAAFASNPIGMGLMLVSTAVSVASSIISNHNEKVDEARRKAADLTDAYKQQQTTLNEQIEKYKELKEQLNDSNISTDESRSIKEQLLEIQNSLIESYGNEVSSIDLVNGKYQEQLEILSELSKEKATDYTAQNYSAYKDAKKALEKERTYDLGTLFSFDTRDGMTEAQEQLYEFVKAYSELFNIRSVQDASTPSNTDFTPKLEVKANVEDAEQIIRQFQKDYEDYIELNGDIDIDTESVKRGISDVLTDIETDDSLNEYKKIYDEYIKAEIIENDKLRPLYQQSIKAVEDYNSALSSGEGIEKAKENLESVKEAVKSASDIVEDSQDVFDDIFNQKMTVEETATNNSGNTINDIAQKISDETPIKTFSQAWAELGDTADEKLKGVQDELLKLAEAGQLSAESLKEVEGAEQYFEDIKLSAQEASNKINELVTSSSQLSSMRTGITSITGALSEKQSSNIVSADTLGKFDVSLQGLESWDEFEETLGNSKSSMEECQQAANNLATEYVNSNNFLSHLTEANKDYYVSQLSNMGVTNALEVVNASLVNSENALAVAQSELIKYSESLADSQERNSVASINLANASASDVQKLFDEANAAGAATNGLRQLLAQKYNANNLAVSTAADCANLAKLYSQSISTANALNALAQAKSAASSGKYIPPQQLDLMTKSAQNAINTANKTQVAPQVQVAGGGGNGGGGGSSKAKESSKTTIDWIERKLERLQKKIDATKAKFDNLFTVKEKASNLDKQIKQTNDLLTANEKAAKKYKTYADKVKLSASLKKKVREGNYSISDYSSKTSEKINKYKEYYDNYTEAAQKTDELKTSVRELREEQYQLYVDDAEAKIEKANAQKDIAKGYKDQNKYLDEQKAYLKQSYEYQIKIAKLNKDTAKETQLQAEYEQELRDLEKEKFDNIEKYYENQVMLIELKQKKIEDKIDLLETKGMMVNARYYESEIAYQKQMRSQYEASQKELQKQLTAMENAALRGTEQWYDAVEALNDVNSSITECDISIADMNNSITDVANTVHEKLLGSLSSVSDEMDWITSLMSEMNMFNEMDGAFTKEGLATLGSYVSGLNTSKYSAALGKGLAEEMQKALDSKKLEFTFNEQTYKFNSIPQLEDAIKDANETWRDQITETYDYSNKIIDMMIEKIESELSALKELIESKKDALTTQKDIHDYQKSIRESTDNVASLQKQIAALQGDTSEEGSMRIQKLQKELSDAQNDLNEKEYDRYMQTQQDMLDRLMDEYESLINEETQNRDALLQKGIDAVRLSADSIKDTIDKYADKYDYTDVLDNIQSGLTTMTGNDSALEQIKTSILSSIEPTGTLTAAITGSTLSVVSGLNNIASKFDQLLKENKDTVRNTTHGVLPDKSEPANTLINRIHGFSKGGVVPVDDIEKQVKANGDKVLVSANPGEGFLTPVQTEMFEKFIGKLPELNQKPDIMPPSLISIPKMPDVQPINNMRNSDINIDLGGVTMYGVNDPKEFAKQLVHTIRTDNKVQKTICASSIDLIAGEPRLGVNKIKY